MKTPILRTIITLAILSSIAIVPMNSKNKLSIFDKLKIRDAIIVNIANQLDPSQPFWSQMTEKTQELTEEWQKIESAHHQQIYSELLKEYIARISIRQGDTLKSLKAKHFDKRTYMKLEIEDLLAIKFTREQKKPF